GDIHGQASIGDPPFSRPWTPYLRVPYPMPPPYQFRFRQPSSGCSNAIAVPHCYASGVLAEIGDRDRCAAFLEEMSVKSLLRALSSLSHLQPRFPGVKTVVPSLIEQIVARIDAIGDLPRESPPLVRVIRHLGSLELSGPVAKSFLAEAVPRLRGEVLKGMDMRALASLARGLAQLGEQPTELFGEIADLLAERRDDMRKKLDIAIHLPMILGAFARAAVYNDSLLETVATVWMKKGNLRKMKGWTLCMMMWAWPWQSEGETAKVVSNFRSRLQMRFKESSVTDEMVEFAWRGPEAFDEVYPKQPLPKKRRGRADAGAWEPARAGLPRRPSAPTRSWLTPPPPV
ncbi:unnamed protein product, partial [Prorocentrum cordatum]